MKHPSLYLDWYIHVPKVKYDFRSSGIAFFRHALNLSEVDLSINYDHGNPDTLKQLGRWYDTKPENVFVSSEGASGQNARIIRYLAERSPRKREAIVEFPTYEPLLRATQEHFPTVKRLERKEKEGYRLDADRLERIVSEETGLLVLTNPHAPSGAASDRKEVKEVMDVANSHGFHVLCDEIYAEFNRKAVPTVFSIDQKLGITTTSFTKAYGLGGLKLGTALADKDLIEELYTDVLNTVGNSPNLVQIIAAEILSKSRAKLQEHKAKWSPLRIETEKWLTENDVPYFANTLGVTYWLKLPISDTYKWVNRKAMPKYGMVVVPGAFFLFKNDYALLKTSMARLGIGLMDPATSILSEALDVLKVALKYT